MIYVVYLQFWTLHTLFVTLLLPNRREAPPIYVSELPSQNKRACMMKVAVWRLTHLKDGPDNFQSSDWCVQHQVLLILGKWLEFCVSCNRPSIFQLHKRHRSEKRTRPETNATKNPGQAMAVVAKRENYDGADGWIVVNYIFLNLLSCNLHQISQGTVYVIERWHSQVAPEFVVCRHAKCIRWSNSYVDTSASENYRCDREILCPTPGGLITRKGWIFVDDYGILWRMYPSYSFVFYDVHLHII